jgi:hypothetical protein
MTYTISIDNFTIISSAVLLVLAIVSSFISPYLRFSKRKWEKNGSTNAEGAESLPPLSVILAPHDEPEAIARNLPAIMSQKYPAGFQIIVVVEKGEGETEDMLKRFQQQLDKEPSDCTLYITYIPQSSRYVSRKKLAMTLGVKAAKTEWLVMTEPTSKPASDTWLQTMAENCTDSTQLVVGYGGYEDEASSFMRFERLNAAYYLMREAARGNAYAALAPNIMIRKSVFMRQDGFLGNLHLIHGEYDFLVNKYSEEGMVALETRDTAWILDDAPEHSVWMAGHIFYRETRKWLERSFAHRAWFNIDQITLHLSFLLLLAGIVWGAVTMNVVLLAAAVLGLILSIVLRTVFGCKAMSAFSEHIPAVLIYPYSLSLVWRNLKYGLRYKFANKLDFTTHKQ